jgi:bifunctional DNase/RNase
MTSELNDAIDEHSEDREAPLQPASDAETDESLEAYPSDSQIPVRFVDVVMVLPSTHPVIILEELSAPWRELRIPIGSPEGIAIAYAARKIDTPRPLTHELFTSTLEAYGVTLEVVRITEADNNAYAAEISFSGPAGVRSLACRPSDGIALALRQRLEVPITAAESVLDQAGSPRSPER